MGSRKVKDRRAGVRQPGPQSRRAAARNAYLASQVQEQARLTRLAVQNARKAKSRANLAKIDVVQKESLLCHTEGECVELNDRDVMRDVEDSMSRREENRLASVIVDCIQRHLDVCPGPRSRRSVIGRVLNHNRLSVDVPDYVLPKKVAVAQQEICVVLLYA